MNAQPTKVVTGRARGSYVNVFAPRMNDLSGKEEYSMTLLIPKTDTDTLAKLKAAAKAAIAEKFGDKPPAGLQSPIHDGDGAKPNGGEYGEECHGHWVVNVKSTRKPGVVDANVQPVLDAAEFQSGDYCRVSLNAYAYDNKRKGVAFGLQNVQVLAKGEPLGGGGSRAEDDFGPASGASDNIPGWD